MPLSQTIIESAIIYSILSCLNFLLEPRRKALIIVSYSRSLGAINNKDLRRTGWILVLSDRGVLGW